MILPSLENIKFHPVVIILSSVVTGFIAGIGAYQGILEIANLEIAKKSTNCGDHMVSFKVVTEPSTATVVLMDSENLFYQHMCISPGRYKIEVSAENYLLEERVVHINNSDYIAVVNLKKDSNPMTPIHEPSSKYGYTGERMTLNYSNVPISIALKEIASFTGLNIVVSDGVKGTITLKLDNVPWDAAFYTIIAAKGLKTQRASNILVVSDK